MSRFILHIYDFLSKRKGLAVAILVIVLGLCGLSASRLSFQEDISDFLPQDEQAAQANSKIAVLFEGGSIDDKLDAMYAFESAWQESGSDVEVYAQADQSQALEVMDFVTSNWPYFLESQDYVRIDSLLATPGYIQKSLQEDKTSLIAPNPFLAKYTRTDPLHLFSPVLSRLGESMPEHRFEDGCLFTPDGETGIIFFESPYGGSESAQNALLTENLNAVKASVKAQYPQIEVYSTGGPEVAAENASRIKKDSILALAIAALLICAILWLSYKRFQDVLWIFISIACGAVFALGMIAFFKTSVSIIILGIGCTVIGIAVNYPLHYVDHLKYEPDKREALRQQVEPLLVGNITTVGAFLGLLLMKAPALRDFGFIGAMMLLGTIIFVLVFLPVFIPAAKEPRNTIKLDLDRHINLSAKARKWVFAAFIGLTVFFAFQSKKVGFDSNLHNINYMTPTQEKGFAVLENLQGHGAFIGSTDNESQQKALSLWGEFVQKHHELPDMVAAIGHEEGFTPDAFAPFYKTMHKDWKVQEESYFAPVAQSSTEGFANRLVEALSGDFDTIGLICSAIVFVFLLLSFRSLEMALLAFLPLAVSWVWIQGIMGLTGLNFNIVNVILATFIFGMGDDYTIFITEGLIYEHKTGQKILHSYKNAVILSAIIMFVGIGVLAFAQHPALRSLGLVTVIGMITVVVMACYLPPIIYRWMHFKGGNPRLSPITILDLLKTGYIIVLYAVVMVGLTVWAFFYFLIGKDSEEKKLRFHVVLHKLAKFAIKSVPGAKYKLINKYGEDFSKPAVYVCNHESHLDILAMLALTPKIAFTTNDWVWNFPLYSYILKKAEYYPASKGHSGNAAHVADLFSRGYSIMVFPEGTRSIDGQILRFHRGAFLTARELDVDVLPLCIHGFSEVLRKHDFILRKGHLTMEVGQRVRVEEGVDIKEFTRNMRHFYQKWYESLSNTEKTNDL